MKRPRVTFRYSRIYDSHWRSVFFSPPKKKGPYHGERAITSYLKKLEKEWRKNEQRVFKAIALASGCKWSVSEHPCYIVGRAIPFSDPLTIPVYASSVPIEYAADVLCHELIHRNLIEPAFAKQWKNAYPRLKKDFPKDSWNVLVHVIVHAIHDQVFRAVFTIKRLEREKRIMSDLPEYRRAWEIVDSMGAEGVIDRYLRS